MQNNKINNFEAISFLSVLSISGLVLSTSRILIKDCGSSSLINVLFITLVAFLVTLILTSLSKQFLGQDILAVSEFLGGKVLKNIVGIIFISYIIFRMATFLRILCACLQNVYYPMTHLIFIASAFCVATGIICIIKNNGVIKSNSILFPLIFLSIILIFMGNSKNFDYDNIYPLLGNGIKSTFLTGASNIFVFCGLIYLFFLPPKLKNPEKITKISLIYIAIFGIYSLFMVSNILLLYSDKLTNTDLFPIYIAVRYIEFGTFFQRLDAAFLFLCVVGFIGVLSLNVYISQEILKNITNVSSEKPLIFPILLTIFALAISMRKTSNLEFLAGNLTKVLFILLAFIIPFVVLLSATIKKKITKKEGT